MLTDAEKAAVHRTWRRLFPIAHAAADRFCQRLLALAPDCRELFGEDLAGQKRELVTALSFIVVSATGWTDDEWEVEIGPDQDLCLVALALGRRHATLREALQPSYEAVGEALLWTLDQELGEDFTPEARAAWTKLVGLVATTMKVGARASRLETRLGEVA